MKKFNKLLNIKKIATVLSDEYFGHYMVRQYQNDKKYRAYFRENIKK